MEVYEDGGSGDDGGDGSGKVKAVKVISGDKEIGTADKGEFIPKKPMKLIVKWGKKAGDPLSLLKKKLPSRRHLSKKGEATS